MPDNAASAQTSERNTIARLDASIIVKGHTDCRVHPARTLCSCRVALASLRPQDIKHCKTHYFRMIWEQTILADEHAFAYDGTQESHHAFTAAAGMTPKHFARQFLQSDASQFMFAPAGKLQVTVQALVDLGIMRTAMWKERYGSLETAKERWLHDEYPKMAGGFVIPKEALDDRRADSIKPGSTIKTLECELEPPDHRCTVVFTPTGKKPQAQDEETVISYASFTTPHVQLCHPGCDVGSAVVKGAMPELLRVAATKVYGCVPADHEDVVRDNSEQRKAAEEKGVLTAMAEKFLRRNQERRDQ